MSNIDIKNGAVVNKIWRDGSTELMAVFQYKCDADWWAARYINENKNGNDFSMARTCLYSGEAKVVTARNIENEK